MDESELADKITETQIRAFTAGFYAQVPTDDLMGPMYPADDLAGAEQRLGDFLCFRLLGHTQYIEERGHPKLRMRHFPFSIGTAERDRWLQLMGRALDRVALDPGVRAWLDAFFAQVADHMRNRMERPV